MFFQKYDYQPLGGLKRVSYYVKKLFSLCSHETDSFHVINIREVALSVILKDQVDRMRFLCRIWALKDVGKCVNQYSRLDLLEKSAK